MARGVVGLQGVDRWIGRNHNTIPRWKFSKGWLLPRLAMHWEAWLANVLPHLAFGLTDMAMNGEMGADQIGGHPQEWHTGISLVTGYALPCVML